MAIIQITLSFDGMNISAQVGDIAYYSYQVNNVGGFDHSKLSTTRKLGEIVGVNVGGGVNIVVEYDDAITFQVPNGSFISFAKEKKINTSSLLGYYADIKFVNNSEKKAELFSVSSEIAESSK
tara:strand:+ start:100 stop:468 length:369 start_codon:yes stop_codon:yes gene_type:complete